MEFISRPVEVFEDLAQKANADVSTAVDGDIRRPLVDFMYKKVVAPFDSYTHEALSLQEFHQPFGSNRGEVRHTLGAEVDVLKSDDTTRAAFGPKIVLLDFA